MTETILFAEDDVQTAELIQVVLENKGYITHWAKDGEEAVEKSKRIRPDLILLDVMMPKLDGYQVLNQLKEDAELKNVPVIFVTVKSETDSKVVGLRMGGHDYITKPFDIDELVARVETVLRIKNENEDLRAENKRLAELSLTDPLTGLFNRRFLTERLKEEFARAKRYRYPLSCIILDIDDFKRINDTFGHQIGDQGIQQMGLIMKNCNRVVDIMVRYGGEEFLALLPQTDLGGARVVAERMRALVEHTTFVTADPKFKVTISLGVSAYSAQDIGTPEELLKQADEALYAAKKAGKNCLRLSGGAVV